VSSTVNTEFIAFQGFLKHPVNHEWWLKMCAQGLRETNIQELQTHSKT